MKKLLVLLFFLSSFSFISFSQRNGAVGSNYDYNCRCLGIELDGSATIESYGKGRNYLDASEQAKKNAVWSVIFSGIKEGSGGCSSDPLLFSPEPQKLYEDFFNSFFSDNGAYTKYVSLKDEKIQNKVTRNSKKGKEMQQRMVVVRVDRAGIKKHLKENNIE
jgi:hypothetical protein